MSTERKPGSRGVRETFSREQADPAPRNAGEPGTRQNQNPKGTSKTVSPRQAFKRKPRK